MNDANAPSCAPGAKTKPRLLAAITLAAIGLAPVLVCTQAQRFTCVPAENICAVDTLRPWPGPLFDQTAKTTAAFQIGQRTSPKGTVSSYLQGIDADGNSVSLSQNYTFSDEIRHLSKFHQLLQDKIRSGAPFTLTLNPYDPREPVASCLAFLAFLLVWGAAFLRASYAALRPGAQPPNKAPQASG